jgi:hypothetical protein
MILDIVYTSNFILAETAPVITGSGTTAVIYDPFIIGTTNVFVTGSGTVIEYLNMIDFTTPTRSINITSGSVLTFTFGTLSTEELTGFTLGPTAMPAGKPYRETIIIS